MPITANDLGLFSSANEPTDDASLAGGAISAVSRPQLDLFTAAAKVGLISDGPDVRTATITGRLATGASANEVLALNGAVEVLSVNTYLYVTSIVMSAGDAARTVTIRQGAAGTTRGTITPNETTRHIDFRASQSAAAPRSFYAKHHYKNSHATLALLSATIALTADPAARAKIGVVAAKGDATSVANRVTVPAGITFVDDNISQAVPGSNLNPGENIGFWVELALLADNVPLKTSYTTQLAGGTI